jgi:hypothetical protein
METNYTMGVKTLHKIIKLVDYLGWLSLMSTLEEKVENGSTKVWVMDPSLFDV